MGLKASKKKKKTSFQEKLQEVVSEKLQEEQEQEENGGPEDVRRVNEILKKLAEARKIHSLNLKEINKILEGLNKKTERLGYSFSHLSIYENSIAIKSGNNYESIDITYSFNGPASQYAETLIEIKKEDAPDMDYIEALKRIREKNRRYFNAMFSTLTNYEKEIIEEIQALILKNEGKMKKKINDLVEPYGIGPIEE